jgi:hypothetical protein
MREFLIEHPTSAESWEEVRPRLEAALRRNLDPGMLREQWHQETLRLVGFGVDAVIELAEGKLRARAALGPPASLFRAKIEAALRSALEGL